jgi:hypothetical protein
MSDFLYDLLAQVVKNTNVVINLSPKNGTVTEDKQTEDKQTTQNANKESEEKSAGLMKADLLQLVQELECVSKTLKKINVAMTGNEQTEMFCMLENFDKILNSVRIVLNAI